jgi:hypothetical protein
MRIKDKKKQGFKDRLIFLILVHFPGVMPGEDKYLRCEFCEDMVLKYCAGKGLRGNQIIECMMEKVYLGERVKFNDPVLN